MRVLSELGRNKVSAGPQGFQCITAQSMGADVTGTAFTVQHTPIVCIQAVWSAGATPVGTLQLQGSVDGTNFFNVGSTVAVSGNSGTAQVTDANAGYLYARMIYTRTSGTATLNAYAEAKGV